MTHKFTDAQLAELGRRRIDPETVMDQAAFDELDLALISMKDVWPALSPDKVSVEIY
jgi:hypothetical protein